MSTELSQTYKSLLKNQFKSLDESTLAPMVSDNLLCPTPIELPKALIAEFQNAIKAFFRLRSDPMYIHKYEADLDRLQLKDPGNKSLFMSYDFHLSSESKPKLIEINTNAAFLALGHYLYKAHGLDTGLDFKIEDLKDLFLQELKLQNKNPTVPHVLIVDEKPHEQKMFLEFLIVQELLQSFGWQCSIADVSDYEKYKADIVYNRYTDFYLNNPEAQAMRRDFLNRATCFSPNPFEYFLLADKQRMIDWTDDGFWQSLNFPADQAELIKDVLPKTLSFKPELKDDLWSKRKHLFFKPKNSFGSKQSYKGASISKKVFEEVANEHFLAQELLPAPEVMIKTPDGDKNFKFDLRCYAYQDQLQLVIARVYQGQVTNLKTKWGGFAPVKWV
ncbi:MAG: hypothetical protein B7Y39_06485 [Bdellovibrio sp. 28-41-41]|nr:MAG: hypothetical protein B7Y39_06485 [Bdellovibrio sp. 28-41-41]